MVIIASSAIALFKIQSLYKAIFFLFTLQAILWLIGMHKNNQLLGKVGYLSNSLDSYIDILKLIEKEEFESILLRDIKNRLYNKERSSLKGIEKLEMIVQMISIRSNGLIYVLLNILFLWDKICLGYNKDECFGLCFCMGFIT